MGTSQKRVGVFLYSTAGVVAMAALLIAGNVIFSGVNVRMDFTAERLYTLTPGTRAILQKMDAPITLRFYYTRDSVQMPMVYKTFAARVADVLQEYRKLANGKITVQVLNPTPDSDAEDAANLDGVRGEVLPTGETVYLGVAVSCVDQVSVLPFLTPERENLLEYDLTRAVYRVLHPDKPVVGVMSSLPVMGQMNPMLAAMAPQNRQESPWLVITEMKRDFELRDVSPEIDTVPADIPVLVVVHPKKLAPRTLFALDQFVLRGGRLLAFLDPLSLIDSKMNAAGGVTVSPPEPSTLGPLLDTWGVKFDVDKIVADKLLLTQAPGADGTLQRQPTWLSLTKEELDSGDPATAQLDSVLMVLAGDFTGDAAAGLKKSVLLTSSDDSERIEKFMAQMGGETLLRDFKSDKRKKALAIRLAGTFKTAFPAGAPAADDKTAGGAGAGANDVKKTAPAQPVLKESAKPGSVVLVGDADMLYDSLCVKIVRDSFGQPYVEPRNDNLSLVQNLVEQLSGDENLISIRSRGVPTRPFLVVARMQAEAERRYQDEIRGLEDRLSAAKRRINELQRQKSKDQKFILSPEQQREVERIRQQQADTNRQLKQVRKELRRDIDTLEAKIKWANIALMPALVGIAGIVAALVRKRRMKVG